MSINWLWHLHVCCNPGDAERCEWADADENRWAAGTVRRSRADEDWPFCSAADDRGRKASSQCKLISDQCYHHTCLPIYWPLSRWSWVTAVVRLNCERLQNHSLNLIISSSRNWLTSLSWCKLFNVSLNKWWVCLVVNIRDVNKASSVKAKASKPRPTPDTNKANKWS